MNYPVNDQALTMTSREIAEVTGKRHPDVKRDIEVMFEQLQEDVSKFASIYTDSMPDYQVTPTDKIITTARYGKERLMKSTAISRAAQTGYSYPSRMPIGSGNKWARVNNWNFYPGKQNANTTVTPDEGDSKESG